MRKITKTLCITILVLGLCCVIANGAPKKTGNPVEKGMILISSGKFWIGCNEKIDTNCHPQEKPGRLIYLDDYFIDQYEVSVKDYRECVVAASCSAKMLGYYDFTDFGFEAPTQSNMCNYEQKDRSNYPMNCVTWFEARDFCAWKGKRLPTEAEWEKAARGLDGRIYPWGNSAPDCDKLVHNNHKLGPGCGALSSFPVGSKPKGRSPFGVYDMAGNVWEWTADFYDKTYFDKIPEANPRGPETGKNRVIKGGAWNLIDQYLRSSYRLSFPPTYRDFNGGFRCAM